nr:hypothetical protein [Microvirga splendida]
MSRTGTRPDEDPQGRARPERNSQSRPRPRARVNCFTPEWKGLRGA